MSKVYIYIYMCVCVYVCVCVCALPLTKMMELTHLDAHVGSFLAVNKLITDKTQNTFFYLMAKDFDLIKYPLNNLDWIIWINAMIIFQDMQRKLRAMKEIDKHAFLEDDHVYWAVISIRLGRAFFLWVSKCHLIGRRNYLHPLHFCWSFNKRPFKR